VVEAPLAVAVGDTEPQGTVAHDTAHVTPLFDASFTTVAVKLAVWPSSTLWVVDGETLTETGGGGVPEPQPEMLAAVNIALRIAISQQRFFEVMANLQFHSNFASVYTGGYDLPIHPRHATVLAS
jgi:hypothetical protein